MSICHRNILNKYYQKCCKLEPLLLALCSLSLSLFYLQVTDQLGNTLKKSIAQYKNSSIIREAWDEVQKTVRKSRELLFSFIDWLCVVFHPPCWALEGFKRLVLHRLCCGTSIHAVSSVGPPYLVIFTTKSILTRMRNTLLLRLKSEPLIC